MTITAILSDCFFKCELNFPSDVCKCKWCKWSKWFKWLVWLLLRHHEPHRIRQTFDFWLIENVDVLMKTPDGSVELFFLFNEATVGQRKALPSIGSSTTRGWLENSSRINWRISISAPSHSHSSMHLEGLFALKMRPELMKTLAEMELVLESWIKQQNLSITAIITSFIPLELHLLQWKICCDRFRCQFGLASWLQLSSLAWWFWCPRFICTSLLRWLRLLEDLLRDQQNEAPQAFFWCHSSFSAWSCGLSTRQKCSTSFKLAIANQQSIRWGTWKKEASSCN